MNNRWFATTSKGFRPFGISRAFPWQRTNPSDRWMMLARCLVEAQAADYINIKIMKTGVIEARRIAHFTRSSGLRLMVGGMLETRIAMGCSFSLVLGLGDFDVLDLDTPLLLSTDPVIGGYRYEGPRLQ
ncbi:MAG: hypothetical protein QM771_11050, partial [Nitrospira sp.]